jgi:CheY-like chemotaxis protein
MNTTAALVQCLCGCEVRATDNAASCVAIAEVFRPHLLLLDLGMPGANGIEVAEFLRIEGIRPPIVAAVTGYGDAKVRKATAEAGFNYHELKPISIARLRELVAEAASYAAAERSPGDAS